MDKPLIIVEREMREELANVANKYINVVPATMIASFLSKLTEQFSQLADTQYKQAIAQYKEESEVNADGREETNN